MHDLEAWRSRSGVVKVNVALDRLPDATFTSSSLLIDKKGTVRHVQPGGPPLWIAAMSEAGAQRAARDLVLVARPDPARRGPEAHRARARPSDARPGRARS